MPRYLTVEDVYGWGWRQREAMSDQNWTYCGPNGELWPNSGGNLKPFGAYRQGGSSWECQRCHRINAPFVLACDCPPPTVASSTANFCMCRCHYKLESGPNWGSSTHNPAPCGECEGNHD